MQILPSKELLPFIRHYLFLESKGSDLKKLRLFSDGSMGIVFSFKNNLFNGADTAGQSEYLPASFLYGQISKFKDVCLRHETDLIVAVFQPTGINQLMGIPADELRDSIVGTEYIFKTQQGQELYEQLTEQKTIQDKLRLLNTFFLEQMTKRMMPDDTLIKASLNFIVKNKGLIASNQLTRLTGYTERHIERKFMEAVGIGPKKFSNIIKLHTFLKQLKNDQNNSLTSTAYESGYTDQSHLIKEFKKITGMTPKAYQNSADKLAINFVKLNNKTV